MMSEGYRWSGVAAYHLWIGPVSNLYYNSWQPIVVLCRQWDWAFGSGQQVKRTFGIFNDTHYQRPVTFTWTLNLNGKRAGGQTTAYTLAPGSNQKFDVSIPMPAVPARQSGELVLTLSSGGKQIFKDVKPLSVLPDVVLTQSASPASLPASLPASKPAARHSQLDSPFITRINAELRPHANPAANTGAALSAKNLFVYDPAGTVSAFLKAHGMGFTPLKDLKTLPSAGKVLIIGKDALSLAESTSSRLAAYAASGRTIIILEQQNPLKYQATPADLTTDTNEGRIAFPEDPDNPIFKGLMPQDFQFWGPDNVVYTNAYKKPTSGGRSILQCESGLQDTALVEVPAGKGLLLLSQLLIGGKLPSNVVAQHLLANLMAYGSQYKQVFRPVRLTATDSPQLTRAMDALGVQYKPATNALDAISTPDSIAVIVATPANLQMLADNLPKVNAFTASGGWIIFNNLTPDGLNSYNKIVGFDHMIRKFRREKVTFPATRNPLVAGLSTADVVMGNGQRIFGFQAGDYPAEDAFSYVVDYDDVAPFGKSPFFACGNITNNFVSADGWPLIINFEAPKDGKPFEVPITLPKPQTIKEFTWIGNTFRIDARRNANENKQNKQYEMARYVLHYADGQTVNVPVYAEINVENFKQKAPATALPGAQLAWSAPYAGTDQVSAAYSMQWNNPRPDVEISSIDFQFGNDRRGVPALLAITAATAQ